jgi:hypothetical protein
VAVQAGDAEGDLSFLIDWPPCKSWRAWGLGFGSERHGVEEGCFLAAVCASG